jgi:hypothetical protein
MTRISLCVVLVVRSQGEIDLLNQMTNEAPWFSALALKIVGAPNKAPS